jgi:hypothetical protein
MLNKGKPYQEWKENLVPHCEDALVSPTMPVKTPDGWMPMGEIVLGQEVLDRDGNPQRVLGVIEEEVFGPVQSEVWHTEWYEDCGGTWRKRGANGSMMRETHEMVKGYALITESGEVIVQYEGKERIIRDFTEVGYDRIHETYDFLAARLRTRKEDRETPHVPSCKTGAHE